jgi:hypothetical protein
LKTLFKQILLRFKKLNNKPNQSCLHHLPMMTHRKAELGADIHQAEMMDNHPVAVVDSPIPMTADNHLAPDNHLVPDNHLALDIRLVPDIRDSYHPSQHKAINS